MPDPKACDDGVVPKEASLRTMRNCPVIYPAEASDVSIDELFIEDSNWVDTVDTSGFCVGAKSKVPWVTLIIGAPVASFRECDVADD